MDLSLLPLPPLDPLWVLAQVAPTDVNTPWMWLSGILAGAVVALFGLYTKKLADDGKEWKTTAKDASAEFPQMSSTLEKSVETLRTQQALIETQVREISTLTQTVTRIERHVEDLRLSIKTDAAARQRAGEQP